MPRAAGRAASEAPQRGAGVARSGRGPSFARAREHIKRSRQASRTSGLFAAVLVALILAGCGGSAASQAVSDAAHVARVVTRLSRREMRSWCPRSVGDRGRRLSQAQARECLKRAWNGWLSELRHDGYDPRKIAQENAP